MDNYYYNYDQALYRINEGLSGDNSKYRYELLSQAKESNFPHYSLIYGSACAVEFSIEYSGEKLDEEREIYIKNKIKNAEHVFTDEAIRILKSSSTVKDVAIIGNQIVSVNETLLKVSIDNMFDNAAIISSVFKVIAGKLKQEVRDVKCCVKSSLAYGEIIVGRVPDLQTGPYLYFSGTAVKSAMNNIKYAGNDETIMTFDFLKNLNNENQDLVNGVEQNLPEECAKEGLKKCRIINKYIEHYYDNK